jgi:hypothetical protein
MEPVISAVQVANRLIVKSCVYCKKKHIHGVGPDPKNPITGQRMAECLKGSYTIKIDKI